MATLVRAYSEVDGAIGEASSINRVIDDIYSTINSLNSANLNSGIIDTTEINDCAVTTSKIAENARAGSLAEFVYLISDYFTPTI